ncbi:MAG: hypothetical protein U0168_26610 [Nannocystaceae bacterium]
MRGTIEEDFKKLGITLTNFVENILLPPEVEKALDAAAAQSARGVDNTMAEGMQAVRDAARTPGAASASCRPAWAWDGVGMGQVMAGTMGQVMPCLPGYLPPGHPLPAISPGYPPPPGYPPCRLPAAARCRLAAAAPLPRRFRRRRAAVARGQAARAQGRVRTWAC